MAPPLAAAASRLPDSTPPPQPQPQPLAPVPPSGNKPEIPYTKDEYSPKIHRAPEEVPDEELLAMLVSTARAMAAMLEKYPNALFLGPGYPSPEFTSPPTGEAWELYAAMYVHRQKTKKEGPWSLAEKAWVRLNAIFNPSFREQVKKQKAIWDGYGSTEGPLEVRLAVIKMLNEDFPGLKLNPERLMLLHGNTQALSVFTQFLKKKFVGKPHAAIVDARTYTGTLSLLRAENVTPFHAEMDEYGPIPASLDAAIQRAKDAGYSVLYYYTMPDGHNPTGLTFPLERRKAILEVLKKHGVYCFEDNAYSYLNLTDDRPIPPLAALDQEGLVAYAVTMSKIFSPGLRMAALHVPFDWLNRKGEVYDVLQAMQGTMGLQTLFSSVTKWHSLLAYLKGEKGVQRSMWELAAERAAFYRGQYEILVAGLDHYFKDRPDIFTFNPDIKHGFFFEGIYGPSAGKTATEISLELLQKHKVVTIAEQGFMPPKAQEEDPSTSRRVRLCFSYTQTINRKKARREIVDAVNAFGQGVYQIYGQAPIAPFNPLLNGAGLVRG